MKSECDTSPLLSASLHKIKLIKFMGESTISRGRKIKWNEMKRDIVYSVIAPTPSSSPRHHKKRHNSNQDYAVESVFLPFQSVLLLTRCNCDYGGAHTHTHIAQIIMDINRWVLFKFSAPPWSTYLSVCIFILFLFLWNKRSANLRYTTCMHACTLFDRVCCLEFGVRVCFLLLSMKCVYVFA